MSIERGDFDAIGETDLRELIEAEVQEGLRIDFKRAEYGGSDADKKELLKDVSAFANSHGGHLVLGVEETEGVATTVVGLDIDTDHEIRRMESILRSGLEPPVAGLRIRPILLESGRSVLLLRIPRSWNPPHRVVAKGENRFYARNSGGNYQPSVEELRALFTQSVEALEQARHFHKERIQTIAAGDEPRPLVGGGRLVLHIVPVAGFAGISHIDLATVYAQHEAFLPIGHISGLSPGFNFDGFINERGGDQNHGYTQVFRNGALEATKAPVVRENNGQRLISAAATESQIIQRLTRYIFGLRDIGVPPPLIIMLSFEGVRNAQYVITEDEYGRPIPKDVLSLPEGVLEDYGAEIDHHRSIRPAFDALWNSVGSSRAASFDEDGRWVGLPRWG